MYWNSYDVEFGVMAILGRTDGLTEFQVALGNALVENMNEDD